MKIGKFSFNRKTSAMKKSVSLLIILFVFGAMNSFAQTISAKTTSMQVDFSVDTKSTLEFFKPDLSTTAKVFNTVNAETLDVEGIVFDGEGIKSFKINNLLIDVNSSGLFQTKIPLLVGSNQLQIKITDNKDNVFEDSYAIVREYTSDNPTTIEFTKPAALAASRGFKKVNTKTIEIAGTIYDADGVNNLIINDLSIELDEYNSFSTSLDLKIGSNLLVVQVIDGNNKLFKQTFSIDRNDTGLNTDGRDYFALIIANQNYDDTGITDLDNPMKDAQNLYDILLNKYSFEEQNLSLLKDPSRSDILDQLDQLSRKVDNKDNLLIFYAGHGYWDEKFKTGYWLPRDSRTPEVSKSAWFSNSTLRDYINGINSKHTLLIADACFSGGIFKTRAAFSDASIGINKLQEMTSRKAMTSGTLTEVPDESVFMKYLLQRLRENTDKYITSESLFASFKTAVLNNSPTVPQYGTVQNAGDEGGDFIFVLKEE